MENNALSTESGLTTPKEAMRKEIRHALANKGVNRFPDLDLSDDNNAPSADLMRDFVVQFRALGGKYLPCSKDQFSALMVKLLQSQNFPVLLNTKPQLSNMLKVNNINFVESIDVTMPADAAIVFCDTMIVSNCSFVFSPQNSLFPSVKTLATNLIIVAMANNIVPDLKTAFEVQMNRNEGKLYGMSEIITPTPLEMRDGKEVCSPLNPRYILVMVM